VEKMTEQGAISRIKYRIQTASEIAGMFTGTGMADYCYHCGQKLEWEV
jgi:hypothetical protein